MFQYTFIGTTKTILTSELDIKAKRQRCTKRLLTDFYLKSQNYISAGMIQLISRLYIYIKLNIDTNCVMTMGQNSHI